MNHAQWDHKYDDCGLTLHFKVGTCGVQAYFLHIPSIFELSTPACLPRLSACTPPIAEILRVKNGRAIVVCGFLMK